MSLDELVQKYRQEMDHNVCHKRTICEVLRESWELARIVPEEDIRKELKARLLTAYDMAKRMNRKLREYKHNWDENFWQDNEDFTQDLKRRNP